MNQIEVEKKINQVRHDMRGNDPTVLKNHALELREMTKQLVAEWLELKAESERLGNELKSLKQKNKK